MTRWGVSRVMKPAPFSCLSCLSWFLSSSRLLDSFRLANNTVHVFRRRGLGVLARDLFFHSPGPGFRVAGSAQWSFAQMASWVGRRIRGRRSAVGDPRLARRRPVVERLSSVKRFAIHQAADYRSIQPRVPSMMSRIWRRAWTAGSMRVMQASRLP